MANRKVAGVCAGLANYFEIDMTLVRILLLTLVFAGGLSIVGYLIAWIAMPKGQLVQAPYALPPVS